MGNLCASTPKTADNGQVTTQYNLTAKNIKVRKEENLLEQVILADSANNYISPGQWLSLSKPTLRFGQFLFRIYCLFTYPNCLQEK